jgi:hypothetical protein
MKLRREPSLAKWRDEKPNTKAEPSASRRRAFKTLLGGGALLAAPAILKAQSPAGGALRAAARAALHPD